MDVNTDFDSMKNARVGLVTPNYQSSMPLFSPPSSTASSPGIQGSAQRPLVFTSDSPTPLEDPEKKGSLGGPLVSPASDLPTHVEPPVELPLGVLDDASVTEADAAALVLNFYSNPIIIAPDGAITPVSAGLTNVYADAAADADAAEGSKKKKKNKRKPLRFGPGGVLKVCGTAGCTYSTKRGDHMRRHKMNMHSVGLKWHYCKIGECTYKCKRKEALARHQASIHDETKWHKCQSFGCDFKNRAKKFIKMHVKTVHGNVIVPPPPPVHTGAFVGFVQN
jgi:hypothetical protein